jgi:UDP-N-acetylmuramoyl-L-alanyl-D-glutamate--2,6-diaminopimelate ligase
VPYAQVRDPQAALGFLAAAYHDFPSRKMVVVGVTGTDGKTTTTTLIHSILRIATGGKAGYISTIAADLGAKTSDTGLHVTTPTAPEVQAYLAQMVETGLTHCVLEMTSHGLAQGRLNGVDIDVAVMTNVTHEHLDYHGTWENYRAAKAIMFEMLSRSHRKTDVNGDFVPKVSVINNDDPSADFFAAIPADRVARYGMGNDAEFKAEAVEFRPDGAFFRVGEQSYTLNLVGAFNVMNALAAIVAASSLDVPVSAIRSGVANVRALSGRMERIDEGRILQPLSISPTRPMRSRMRWKRAARCCPKAGSSSPCLAAPDCAMSKSGG